MIAEVFRNFAKYVHSEKFYLQTFWKKSFEACGANLSLPNKFELLHICYIGYRKIILDVLQIFFMLKILRFCALSRMQLDASVFINPRS